MAIFSRHSFQRTLFASVATIYFALVACFLLYQWKREKEYKIDLMHSQMQMVGYDMVNTLGKDSLLSEKAFRNYMHKHSTDSMRATIIGTDGTVLIDSRERAERMQNHLTRTEVQQALKFGNGYDIKRTSETLNEQYFYSAVKIKLNNGKEYIIRIAKPYSNHLASALKANNDYIIYSLVISLLMFFALYRITLRISRHIGYLRQFAIKAENGQEFDSELEQRLPDDELGDISHTIITLYWKLRHSEADKQRIKHQLTQNAAHELKTPASSIMGYLETIMTTPNLSEEKRRHFLERCYAQSQRMSKLLLDMSTLTQLDEGQNIDRSSQINIDEIIDNIVDDSTPELQAHGISVRSDLPSDTTITGDRNLIYSVFRNLFDNAIAYARGADTITISSHDDGSMLSISFADNGCGVSPEHLPHLFERFYRTDKGRSRRLGGTGLGLAIVKNAIMLHGGTCCALTTNGGGLTIQFTLRKRM